MKKIIFFFTFLCCLSMASAQSSGDVTYGFRLGLNSSTLSQDGVDYENRRYGLHANFFADIKLNDRFSLQPEIGVSALGVNENEIRLDNGEVTAFKRNWLHSNVLANINLNKNFYVLVGPQVGVSVAEDDGVTNRYNFDIAGIVGLGYMLDEVWSIDARYGYSIPNFDKDTTEPANRWFQLGVSVRL
jgi:opacity protein-like surface antigen